MKLMHQRLKTTTVYVTHDQIEAMTLGDKVAVMKDGIIQQFGTPKDIYNNPANLFVASFIGSPPMNFIKAQAVRRLGRHRPANDSTAEDAFVLPLREAGEALRGWIGKTLILGVRPEQISDATSMKQSSRNVLARTFRRSTSSSPPGPDTLAVRAH